MPPPHTSKVPDGAAVADNEKSDSLKETSFDALPLNDFDFDNGPGPQPDPKSRRQFSPYFALCLSTFSLAFCCFLVHGAVARQPTHLLPFFFLQVFDFIISLLTIVGYMSSASGVRMWLHTKDGSVYVSSMSLAFLMLSISCMVLAIKAYCLGMVWDCYKYLMLTYQTHPRGDVWSSDSGRFSFLPTFWSFLGGGGRRRSDLFHNASQRTFETNTETNRAPPTTYDQTNDLPNYEDALKIPANAYAPPPYFCPTTKESSATNVNTTQSTDTATRPPGPNNQRDHPSA